MQPLTPAHPVPGNPKDDVYWVGRVFHSLVPYAQAKPPAGATAVIFYGTRATVEHSFFSLTSYRLQPTITRKAAKKGKRTTITLTFHSTVGAALLWRLRKNKKHAIHGGYYVFASNDKSESVVVRGQTMVYVRTADPRLFAPQDLARPLVKYHR